MSEHSDVPRVPDEFQHDHATPAPTQRQGRIYYSGRAGAPHGAPADSDRPHPAPHGGQQPSWPSPGRGDEGLDQAWRQPPREHRGGAGDQGWDGDGRWHDDGDEGSRLPAGHGHHHGTDVAVSRHTTRAVLYVLVPCAIATVIAMVLLWPGPRSTSTTVTPTGSTQRAYGEVQGIQVAPCPSAQPSYGVEPLPCGRALVRITDGPGKGQDAAIDLPQGPGAPRLAVGDDVVLGVQPVNGSNGQIQYAITDRQRGGPLVLMLALCAMVIVAFGRLRGLTALLGLVVSFAALLLFVIPAILAGESPLLVAIVGSSAIMFAVLFLTHGINVHTSVAVLGTLASLVLTGLLGAAFIATTALTGFGSEETLFLSIMNGNVDMRGLLLAGIIIGALGVLDDVTVTQATTVAELAQTATSRLDLYRSAIRIGRAHVASAVNTIILAYAGASLPLLLLIAAGGQDVSDLLTSQFLAQEIVRAAVGTIGLVAAVPITTGLAALVADIRHGERRAGTHSQDGSDSTNPALSPASARATP